MRVMLIGLLVVSCSGGKKASFEKVEESRLIAKENAQQLSQIYRAENKLTDWKIYVRGDSTISADCVQGDGWASIDLLKGADKIQLKCSTVSLGIGCMTSEDFKGKSYASQDGKCNKDIPQNLPKLTM